MSEKKTPTDTNALPVPTGGNHLPASLEKANATALKAIPALPVTNHGKDYDSLKAQREQLDTLRKCLMAVPRHVGLLRSVDLAINKTKKAQHAKPAEEAKQFDRKLNMLADKRVVQAKQRDDSVEELRALQPTFADDADITACIKHAIEGAAKERMTKAENADYGEVLKRGAQQVFGTMAKLLAQMKAAKKANMEAQKENQ